MNNEFGFELDDDELRTSLVFKNFGEEEVAVIYLELEEVDDRLLSSLRYFLDNQDEFYNKAMLAIKNYAAKKYNACEFTSKLLTLYIYDEVDRGYGLLFKSDLDEEHGVGIIFEGLELNKIGSADIIFSRLEWKG